MLNYLYHLYDRLYDSLLHDLEKSYNEKFVVTHGIKDSKLALEKNFEYNFLTVNKALTIGIAISPERQKKERKVVVRFMHELPLGRMGIIMGNLL